MKRVSLVALSIATSALVGPALAQPPGGPHHGNPEGRGPTNAVLAAIDADGNHEISSKEMKNAVAALKSLDTNKDGKLVRDEIHPDFGDQDRGGPGRQGGPGERRSADFAQRIFKYDTNKDGKLTSEEIPERMRTVLVRYDANKNGSLDKTEVENMAAVRIPGGQAGRAGRGGPQGQGRERGGPPNSEQMVADAMLFDADEDGKLSRAELTKFAEDLARRGPPGGGPGRDRGGFGDNEGRLGGDRSQRPVRPE